MIKHLTTLIEEASRFEKEIQKQPFDKQVEWRRKVIANAWKSIKPRYYFGSPEFSKQFINLNYLENNNNIKKKKKFLNDFKISQRKMVNGLLKDKEIDVEKNRLDKIRNPNKYLNDRLIKKHALESEKQNMKINMKLTPIVNNGGYYALRHDFGQSAIKNKGFRAGERQEVKGGLWLQPVDDGSINLNMKNYFAGKAYDVGDIPGEMTGVVTDKYLLQPSVKNERIISRENFDKIKNLKVRKTTITNKYINPDILDFEKKYKQLYV